MVFLNWVCFLLVCLDTLSYIIEQTDRARSDKELSGRIAKFVGLLVGLASRVYVLYNTVTHWLLV